MRRLHFHPAQSGQNRAAHLVWPCNSHSTQDMILQIIPHIFVGIQFRRIWRQQEKSKPILRLFDELTDHHRFVRRVAVYDQKDWPAAPVNQSSQVFDKNFRSNSPLYNGKMHLPRATDRRNQVHAKSCSRRRHNRRFSSWCPCGSTMRIRSYSRFISKKDMRTKGFGFFADERVLPAQPVRHSLWILLIRSPQRTLGAQPQLIHQATNRRPAQRNAKMFVNNFFHHVQRPQRKRKFQLQRILRRHCFVNPAHLFARQFSRPASTLAGIQHIPSSISIQRKPSKNSGPTHAQRVSHFVWRIAFLYTRNGSSPQISQRFSIQPSSVLFHAQETSKQSILCPDYYGKLSKYTGSFEYRDIPSDWK